jgi:hypothetical protein
MSYGRGEAPHHFNYEIQCYINHGRVMGCFHPDEMQRHTASCPPGTSCQHPLHWCCNQKRFQGLTEHAAVQKLRTERALINIERIGRGLAPR